jgi:hypothetical protein
MGSRWAARLRLRLDVPLARRDRTGSCYFFILAALAEEILNGVLTTELPDADLDVVVNATPHGSGLVFLPGCVTLVFILLLRSVSAARSSMDYPADPGLSGLNPYRITDAINFVISRPLNLTTLRVEPSRTEELVHPEGIRIANGRCSRRR